MLCLLFAVSSREKKLHDFLLLLLMLLFKCVRYILWNTSQSFQRYETFSVDVADVDFAAARWINKRVCVKCNRYTQAHFMHTYILTFRCRWTIKSLIETNSNRTERNKAKFDRMKKFKARKTNTHEKWIACFGRALHIVSPNVVSIEIRAHRIQFTGCFCAYGFICKHHHLRLLCKLHSYRW